MKAESRATRAAGGTIARILITVAAIGALAIATVAFADAAGPRGTLRAIQPMRGATKRVVKKAHNRKLGRTILVNLKGHTLYSLSAEKHGRFICTDSSCLSVWHPLTVPSGTTPTGPVKLGTLMRPDGGTQVRYRGLPLYTFAPDKKPGQVGGEGFKDVGTWHAARVPKHGR